MDALYLTHRSPDTSRDDLESLHGRANNPAGRLYELLSKYEVARQAHQASGTRHIWANALAVGLDEVPVALARHSALIAEVASAADLYAHSTGDSHPVETVEQYSKDWSAPFFFAPVADGQGWSTDAGKVDLGALTTLRGLASLFSATSPEGREVSDEVRRELRDEVDALIAQVRDDPDLDPALKGVVLKRLHQIAEALDQYAVTGPAGLVDSSELLVAALLIAAHDKPEMRSRLAPLKDFALKVYGTVTFIGASGEAALALGMAYDAVKRLTGG